MRPISFRRHCVIKAKEVTVRMRAAVLHKPNQSLAIEDVDVPEIGENDVLVRVKACGICRSDLHFFEGTLKVGKLPLVLGHEASGIVERAGTNVHEVSQGDRVTIYFYLYCGKCRFCEAGQHNLCIGLRRFGMDCDGAFGEFTKVPARNLVKLPDCIGFAEGAILGCAVGTSYHALRDVGRLMLGETVAIYGTGGLGLSAVQIANMSGARTIAVDISDMKLEHAKRFGADATINASKENPVDRIRDLTDNTGVDLSVEFVGSQATIQQAIDSTRKNGRVVLVGFSGKTATLDPNELIVNNLTICGSRGLLRQNLVELIELVASGKLNLKENVSHRIELDEVNRGLDLLRSGEALRVLIEFR